VGQKAADAEAVATAPERIPAYQPGAAGRGPDDIVIADFESATWESGWTTTGTAFGDGPVHGAGLLAQMDVVAYRGDGVASSERQGDGPTGTLTSPSFQIQRSYIAFAIGGGDYERVTCLNLLVDGQVVRSATGRNSDTMMPASWDVRAFSGRMAQIQIVDQATGGWGHVIVDHIVQTDRPERPPVTTQPLYQETWRPQFHFTARQWTMDRLNPDRRQEGWLNDLNGLIFYEGEYHLFAQRWNKCWIHAVSTDLVHWTELQPAFFEEQLDTGVQSGSCVIDYNNTSRLSPDPANPPMVAFWSRNDNISQCISYSLDRGRTWTHYAGNPIMKRPERDPKVFWYAPGNHWVMMLYGNGQYHILTSPNLLDWTDTGHSIPNSFECPDFFQLPLDGDASRMKWVLVRGNGRYSIGGFDGTRFTEETPQFTSDVGSHFYATQTWGNNETGDGRRLQAAWMRGGGYPNMPFNQQVTFPCELTLHSTPAGPRLFRVPAREIASLHTGSTTWSGRTLAADETLRLTKSGDLFHVTMEVSIPQQTTLTLDVLGVPVLLKRQSVANGTGDQSLSGPLRKVEVLVDRTSIEVFANDGEVSISRCYLPSAGALSLTATGGSATLTSAVVHRLRSAWPRQEKAK
jgi:sucrose-6-phosphate hydrolase SacC (GH32 family)